MVVQTRSENLSPKHWERVRAWDSSGTSPSAQETENSRDNAQSIESGASGLLPAVAQDKTGGPVADAAVREGINPMALVPRGTQLFRYDDECIENAPVALAPIASGNGVERHVPAGAKEGVNPMELAERGHETVPQMLAWALQSGDAGLKPSAIAAQTAPQLELPTMENKASGINPNVSGDKLEGYVPRYFLKEDGKHDHT